MSSAQAVRAATRATSATDETTVFVPMSALPEETTEDTVALAPHGAETTETTKTLRLDVALTLSASPASNARASSDFIFKVGSLLGFAGSMLGLASTSIVNSNHPNSSDSGHLSGGAVIGIMVGSAALGAMLGAAAAAYLVHRRNSQLSR